MTLNSGDTVSGSGLLLFFNTPLALTLKDMLTLMIVVSDNTATNLAIDRFGVDTVSDRLARLELEDRHLYKKIGKPATGPMPADQSKFGLSKTTAREMETLMERIGLCQLDPPATGTTIGSLSIRSASHICDIGLTMLRNQFYRETISRYLEIQDTRETGVGIATKPGAWMRGETTWPSSPARAVL